MYNGAMQFHKKVLKNGLRIVVVPMKENETVTVYVMVEAGTKYETKAQNGISHFLEHMCFKGSTKYPSPKQISFEFDRIGAQNNAFTSSEWTAYFGKAHISHLDTIFSLVSDMYLNPVFPADELEKERGVILEEINLSEDKPERKAWDIFGKLLYGNQPAGWTTLGPASVIKHVTRNDFLKYHKKFYVPSATVVAVAGNIIPAEVFKKVAQAFGTIPKKSRGRKLRVAERQTKSAVTLFTKDTQQAHLILGVRAFDMYHKDRFILGVLTTVLGQGMSSRLFTKIRDDLGMAYYVQAFADLATDHGVFGVRAGVTTKRINEALEAILVELRRLCTEVVPHKELQKAKDFKIGNMFLNLESSDSFAEHYGFSELFHEDMRSPQEIAKKIRAVTAKDIQRVAKSIIRNDRLNLAIVGPFKDKKPFERILHL